VKAEPEKREEGAAAIVPVIKLRFVKAASWVAEIEIAPGDIYMQAAGKSARAAFEAIEAMMEDAAIGTWFQ
jgi:predicted negative regulator of RcsB-dependent stress response